ncbi:MAG: class IV adenylate cyclase [Planctomycetota bacterium]|jgi:adenylate cyclase class 2|nr:class IV adenylate cyclase [Planctomycetota bacterium]
MAMETEAKIRMDDLVELAGRLFELGAVREGECLERNWVLDDETGSLEKRGLLLRVRSLGDVGGIFTVKRPAEAGRFKTREEMESMVDSTSDFLSQLHMLGYHVSWIYEKRRQTWQWKGCVLSLDECPEMGSFIEIEGSADKIIETCVDLGLDSKNHLDDNYLGLWQKYLAGRGEAKRNMLFKRDDRTGDHDFDVLEGLF